MILKRIAEGIKNQDWFVVGVEIMVVVVGIFIGLQVEAWNQERKDIQWEAVFLKNLKADLLKDINQFKKVDKIQISKGEALKKVLALLEKPDPAQKNEFDKYFHESFFDNSTFFPSTGVYLSALSSSKIELMRDTQLKHEILNLYEHHYKRLVYNGEQYDVRNDGLKFEAKAYYTFESGKIKSWENIIDPQFQSVVERAYDHYIIYQNMSDRTQGEIQKVLKSIDKVHTQESETQ